MMYWIVEGILGTCSMREVTPKGAITVDVRDLEDGWNPPEAIGKKIDEVLKCINMGVPVIIQCAAGMSRSNAIAVAVLTKMNGNDWNENEKYVMNKVKRTQIEMSLRDACLEALEE